LRGLRTGDKKIVEEELQGARMNADFAEKKREI